MTCNSDSKPIIFDPCCAINVHYVDFTDICVLNTALKIFLKISTVYANHFTRPSPHYL